MVVDNVNRKDKINISQMYDKLETQLQALDSLGIKSKENSCWLYPLVESSLSDEMLMAWQRSHLATVCKESKDSEIYLEKLMEFLNNEVKADERMCLAKSGFKDLTLKDNSRNLEGKSAASAKKLYTTTSSLMNNDTKVVCIFCQKSHNSRDCIKAQSMTYEDRKGKIQASKSCFKCLNQGHFSRNCVSPVKCMVCGEKHLTIACKKLVFEHEKNPSGSQTVDKVASVAGELKVEQVNVASNQCTNDVSLQTLVVKIIGKGSTKFVRALIDSGSQRSYILESTADELSLIPTSQQKIKKSLFGGKVTGPENHYSYGIIVKDTKNEKELQFNCLSAKKICGNISRICNPATLNELKQHNLIVTDVGNDLPEIEILFGNDVYGKILTGKLKRLQNGLTAIGTIFGWTLSGVNKSEEAVSMLITTNLLNNISLPLLWDLEAIGIRDPVENKNKGDHDRDVKKHFCKTVIRRQDGRYCVALPWVVNQSELPDNYIVAEKRLKNMSTKLVDKGLYAEYDAVFQEWLRDDVVEEIESNNCVDSCHFLPHRAVVKMESKTTKIRPVFDASCKSKKFPSLNDCLEKGPNLIELIPSLLYKFRVNKIGVVADVKKAFLQIEIQETDRKFLRFLWYDNQDMNRIRILQHKRVVFGLTCSPFLLAAVIEKHLGESRDKYKEISNTLLKSFYIDNCVTSVENEEEFINFKNLATELMKQAKMELRLWEYGPQPTLTEQYESSVLGLVWNRKLDNLRVKFDEPEITSVTKRKILSVVNQIFDPIGFLAPIVIIPKLILQQTWYQKYGWDQVLPKEYELKFNRWIKGLSHLKDIAIPRKVSVGQIENFSLHVFCDASEYCYATVVYLRSELNDIVEVQLSAAKARIKPMKKTIIPRLELLACVIGTRLVNEIISALDFHEVKKYFWTDSSTVLYWIKNNDQWGTFVGNRLKEINSSSDNGEWRHIPGNLNPADLPSRGCSAYQLLQSKWWEGPPWLKSSENEWPKSAVEVDFELINNEKRRTICSLIKIENGTAFYYKYSHYPKLGLEDL